MDQTITDIAEQIRAATKIIVLAGAGISVSCGIPDFRSPRDGVYANLGQYNLPLPTMMFTIDYFKLRPRPFYQLVGNLFPPEPYKHSLMHSFLGLLYAKQQLSCLVTQNIEDLEVQGGVPNPIQAHGSFMRDAYCILCEKRFPALTTLAAALDGAVPYCECGGSIKPGVVFFGEGVEIPNNMWTKAKQADLLIVAGTSLNVGPVNQIPKVVQCRRILANRELVGNFGEQDLCFLGDCDEFARQVAAKLGWTEELEQHRQKQLALNRTWGDYLAEPAELEFCAFAGELLIPTAVHSFVGQKRVMFGMASEAQLRNLRKCECEVIDIQLDDVPDALKPKAKLQVKLFTKGESAFYGPPLGHYSSFVTEFVQYEGADAWDLATSKVSSAKIGQLWAMFKTMYCGAATECRVRVDALDKKRRGLGQGLKVVQTKVK